MGLPFTRGISQLLKVSLLPLAPPQSRLDPPSPVQGWKNFTHYCQTEHKYWPGASPEAGGSIIPIIAAIVSLPSALGALFGSSFQRVDPALLSGLFGINTFMLYSLSPPSP